MNPNKNYKFEIIVPKGNYNKLLDRCISLGIINILIAYPFKEKDDIKKIKNNIEKNIKYKNLNLDYGLIIENKENKNLLRKIYNSKNDYQLIIDASQNIEDLRYICENFQDIIIFNLEKNDRMDFIHQKNSGINHIIAKIISKNKSKIALNFSNYINADNKSKKQIIGRIKQNLELCKKFKIEYLICSFASNVYEIKSSLNSLELSLKNKKHFNSLINNF